MPYGLVNAPAVFQNFMDKILRDFLHWFVIIYFNDILIFSRSKSEHEQHIMRVLQSLHEFIKAEKCSFYQTSVKFLGYVIDQNGVRMDEEEVFAISTWPEPTTIKEMQRFLDFANFFWRFIADYSIIASPLTSLLCGKPRSLKWTPEATSSFQRLTQAFISALILIQYAQIQNSHSWWKWMPQQPVWEPSFQKGKPPERVKVPPMCLFFKEIHPDRKEL